MMRWTSPTKQERDAAMAEWHPFFAIWPRRVGRQMVMFETLERRRRSVPFIDPFFPIEFPFEYRLPEHSDDFYSTSIE